MKRISHGKKRLTPRQKKSEGFFIFDRFLTTFAKCLKRTGQIQIEYMLLLAVVTAVVVTVGLKGCFMNPSMVDKVRYDLERDVFRKAADEMKHTGNWTP